MRANQLMTDAAHWQDARALYEKAVQLDPGYAPAWAQLGRARRVLAKWGGQAGTGLLPLAQAAFARALDLDPDFSLAIDLGAYVDAELGQAPQAMPIASSLPTFSARVTPWCGALWTHAALTRSFRPSRRPAVCGPRRHLPPL